MDEIEVKGFAQVMVNMLGTTVRAIGHSSHVMAAMYESLAAIHRGLPALRRRLHSRVSVTASSSTGPGGLCRDVVAWKEMRETTSTCRCRLAL